jgi:uncharacterized protein (DUF1330 family)
MSVHLIVSGVRKQGTDEALGKYQAVAGPLLGKNGGVPSVVYRNTENIVGDGVQSVTVIDFPDEDSIHAIFGSDEYQSVVPDRDAAFESLDIFIAQSMDPKAR